MTQTPSSPPSRRLRELPFVGRNPRQYIEIPGVGTFVAQSVGNCNHTTGLDIYFHGEGQAEAAPGVSRYQMAITPEGKTVWNRNPHPNRHLGAATPQSPDGFGETVETHALRLAEALPQRDPSSYMFHCLGAVERELEQYQSKERSLRETIQHLNTLLNDPRAPHPYTSPTRERITFSPKEREARRALWTHNLAHSTKQLQKHEETHGARVALLAGLRKHLRTWFDRVDNAKYEDVLSVLEAS